MISYCLFITTISCYCILAEAGEDLRSKTEMLFINAQQLNWYYWNKENKNLLLMFLLVTQKPLELNCHGFLVQSREMLLKVIFFLITISFDDLLEVIHMVFGLEKGYTLTTKRGNILEGIYDLN
uniref:Uncharacterized protein LOC114338052 n=1 Tax=Diabrotica virgifera virgifera TaxID=50390 RepID=A0A6P7G5X8_DIAVI